MTSYWFMLFLSWITALFVSPLLLFPDVSLSAGLAWLLWIMFAFWLFHRARHFQP